MRIRVLLALPLLLACSPAEPGDDEVGESGTSDSSGSDSESGESESGESSVLVSGDAFAFTLPGEPYGRIEGATITVLEAPEFSTLTDAEGHFELPDLPPGSLATFTLSAEGFPPARTKTFTLPEAGPLERVTFQVPDLTLYGAIASIVGVELDPAACQIVSTVTRVGKSIYDEGAHGEAGATVTIDPLGAEQGPIYFNADVIPDPSLSETSDDGGVVFVNVPPGEYVLTASKDGVAFESVTMQCEAGVLVNASPPYGLQAI